MRINISSNTWNGYTAENQEERLFFNETAFLFWCHALWKLGSSNCCIFETKHATGMETCVEIYFLFILDLVEIGIRKTSLFWPYNLTSMWKLSILSLFSLSIVLLFILIIAIAGTWILAAIYVKHHETSYWQYAFAGACGFQVIFQYCLRYVTQYKANITWFY